MTKKWQLNMDEVRISIGGGSRGGHTKNTKSRAKFLTYATVCVEHVPTKIILEEEIQAGHYTRSELRELAHKKQQELLVILAKEVAKVLRIPGL